MLEDTNPIRERIEQIRRLFDESFVEAYRPLAEPHDDFIAIQVAGNPYAIRLSEISGVFKDKHVTFHPRLLAGAARCSQLQGNDCAGI